MYTLNDLNHFIAHVPIVTCCIEAQSVIVAALKKRWSAETLAMCDSLPSKEYDCSPINQLNKIHLTKADIYRQYYVEDVGESSGLRKTVDPDFKFKDIIPLIRENLGRYEIVSVTIELEPADEGNPSHSFVLIQIDGVVYIVDAYGGYRTCEYRVFDFNKFEDILQKPVVSEWNKLFRSKEVSTKEYSKIWLEVGF